MLTAASRGAAGNKPANFGFELRKSHRRVLFFAIIAEALCLLILGQRIMFDEERRGLWVLTWAVGLVVFVILDALIATAASATAIPASPLREWVPPLR